MKEVCSDMANLLIDIGNLSVKAAWAEGAELKKCYRYQGYKVSDFIRKISAERKIGTIAIAGCKDSDASLKENLYGLSSEILFVSGRKASVIAAHRMFGDRPLMIVDFGSMITIDFVDKDGGYLGGAVSPGLRTRYKAVNRYSQDIPLFENREDFPDRGFDIAESVHAGINSGIIFEIQGYLQKYPENLCVFTGGDAFYFASKMKTPIFVVCNLVLKGLAIMASHDILDEIA